MEMAGAGGDGRGGTGDERPAARETSRLDEDEDDGLDPGPPLRLYRSFSTGPWLEPVLKGL